MLESKHVDWLIYKSIFWMQDHLSAESLTLWMFLVCGIAILLLLKYYGLFGLYVYNCLAIIFANIQVLRVASFQLFPEPVALGTVLFTTTFLVNDIITEHYGAEQAKRAVTLGFLVQLLSTIWMVLALGHPLPTETAAEYSSQTAHKGYLAMLQIFSPSVRILLASLTAYLCSQWLDIYIFSLLRRATSGKLLWLRQNTAMLLSGLLDTFMFSAIAWILLSDIPISWHELIMTYVISAQVVRVVLNISFTPLMYLSYRCLPKNVAFSV